VSGKIDIDERGRAYIIIMIRTMDKTEFRPVKFLFDTGADFTSISSNDLSSLGYTKKDVEDNMERYGSVSVADGSRLDSFQIDLTVTNIFGHIIPQGLRFPFICLGRKTTEPPFILPSCKKCNLTGTKDTSFNSLLGNNILSCFDIWTDRTNGAIHFERLLDLTERNEKYPGCEMLHISISSEDDFYYESQF